MTPFALRMDWNDGSAVTFFKYLAGDSLAAATFSRPSAATYFDINGVVQTAGAGAVRDAHYLNGRRTILIEPQRTNAWINSGNLSLNVAGTGLTAVTPGATTAPDNSSNGAAIQEDTSTGAHLASYGTFTVTANQSQALSVFLKPSNRTVVRLQMDDGVGSLTADFTLTGAGSFTTGGSGTLGYAKVLAVGNGWYRCILVGVVSATGTALNARFGPVVGGSNSYTGNGGISFYGWGAQLELGANASSLIPTSGTAATRSLDAISWPYTAAPQAMTYYLKGQDAGVSRGVNTRLLSIGGDGSGTGVQFNAHDNLGDFEARTEWGGNNLAGIVVQPENVGDTIELRGIIIGDGTFQFGESLNGAAEQVSAIVSSGTAPGAFSPQTISLMSGETGGFAFEKIAVAAGVKSMAYMETL